MIKRNGYDFVLTSLSASDFFPTFTLCVSLKQTYRLLRSAATHATGCRRRATQHSWWGAERVVGEQPGADRNLRNLLRAGNEPQRKSLGRPLRFNAAAVTSSNNRNGCTSRHAVHFGLAVAA